MFKDIILILNVQRVTWNFTIILRNANGYAQIDSTLFTAGENSWEKRGKYIHEKIYKYARSRIRNVRGYLMTAFLRKIHLAKLISAILSLNYGKINNCLKD